MRDHEITALVNELVIVATTYAESQQLREHLAPIALKIRNHQDRDTRHACAEALMKIPRDHTACISLSQAHNDCMNVQAK